MKKREDESESAKKVHCISVEYKIRVLSFLNLLKIALIEQLKMFAFVIFVTNQDIHTFLDILLSFSISMKINKALNSRMSYIDVNIMWRRRVK
jgi:hypothetical protein